MSQAFVKVQATSMTSAMQTSTPIPTIADELERLGAGYLLADLLPNGTSTSDSIAPTPIGASESSALVTLCQNNRLAPILGDAVHTGQLILADQALPELATSIEHYLASQLRVECAGMAVIDTLIRNGVDFRMLKGMATAHLDYPNPAMRPTGDLDILVQPKDIPAVIESLSKLEGGDFQVLPGNDWRVTHALPFRLSGIEIDVHNRLLHQAAGHSAARLDLFADPAHYEIAGRRVRALPPWLRLLQAASQNVIGGSPKLSSDLDVARLAGHETNAISRAREVGLGWVVAEGIRRSQQALAWGHPGAVPALAGWRDRAFERTYGRGTTSVQAAAVLEFTVAPMALRAALTRSAVLPGRAYLENRGRSPGEQVLRQIKRIGRSRR